jgi:hypothetical protein
MIPQYLIDAICSWWTRRTLPNRLARALPDIVARKRKIEESKRKHKRSSALEAEQFASMYAALKGEK